jgi:Ser/Thr protein kinase RdoA (MazF antagonist)
MLFALREAEIPVCAPMILPDGETLHEVEGIFHAVWPRTGGRSPDEVSDAEVAVLGRLLARIHNVGEATGAPHRPALTPEAFPLAALAGLERGGFLPPSCAGAYRRAVLEVVRIYEERARGIALHPIHGDCHMGNLLRGPAGDASEGDAWFFLDFDDLVVGPAVQDVWMLLPGRDAPAARQRQLLVDAYREFRGFEERSFALVEPLRAFRFVWYAGWIARRWDDPAFPDAFPHFGTEQYWENETRDLAEQVERIQSGGVCGSETGETARSGAEAAELSNRDLFWDL